MSVISQKLISKSNNGSVVLLALGAISLLIILFISLTSQLSRHMHTITLIDQNTIARNFLESFSNDVLHQLQKQMDDRDGQFFKEIQDWTKEANPPAEMEYAAADLGYEPGKSLRAFAEKYEGNHKFSLSFDANPAIKISNWKVVEPPKLFKVAAGNLWPEREASIMIKCRAKFGGKKYQLTLKHKFRLVLKVLPVLKDFAFFFDRISEEQIILPDGSIRDGLNVVPVEYGEVERNQKFPLVLGSFYGVSGRAELIRDPNFSGRVYLGRENKAMVLNLAGEIELKTGKGRFSDLWLLRHEHFNGISAQVTSNITYNALQLKSMGLLQNPNNPQSNLRTFRGASIPVINPVTGIADPYVSANLYCIGFGKELLAANRNGIFHGVNWSLNSFIGNDPGYKSIMQDVRNIKLTSGLKLYGLNLDVPQILQSQQNSRRIPGGFRTVLNRSTRNIPNREIYGGVARRYLILSYFGIGSRDGPLYYMPANSYQPVFLTKPGLNTKYYFNPPGPGGNQNYSNYLPLMSRVVSGDLMKLANYRGANNSFPLGFEGYGFDDDGMPLKKPRSSRDFSSPEGIRLARGKTFDDLNKYISGLTSESDNLEGVLGRVCKCYSRGGDFINAAIKDGGQQGSVFNAGGISFINSDLDLSDGISETNIKGGIIIVNGTLKLGSIARGADVNDFNSVTNKVLELEQSDALTFIVLPGEENKIHLTGKNYLGVHLAYLAENGETKLEVTKPFRLFGALSLSKPNLKELTSKLKDNQKETMFYYLPSFGKSKPITTFNISNKSRIYRFGIL
jgi:hypothetical protein